VLIWTAQEYISAIERGPSKMETAVNEFLMPQIKCGHA
jgi:hypothetical protein